MTPLELSAADIKILDRVKKMLAIAENDGATEAEASTAAAMAAEMLEAYNLDIAQIGHTAKGPQGREDKKRRGGLYKWQRYLWEAVAELNFCMYWSVKGTAKGSTYQHRILGAVHNVVGAEVLADYLQQTIERIAKEEARERGINVFKKEMIAFREGMATRLCQRLIDLRRERLREERRKAEEAAANQPEGSGQALVLQSLIQDEDDLNNDYRFGREPGTTAQRRRDMDARWEARKVERRQWELDNPEEAAIQKAAKKAEDDAYWKAEEKKERARERRREREGYREPRSRKKTAEEKRRDLPEFREGVERGETISLNQQVDEGNNDTRSIGG